MLVRHSKLTIQFWAPQLPSSFLRGWHCWLFTYSRTTRISVELCMAYSGVWLSTFNWSCLQGSLHVAFRPKPSRTTKKLAASNPSTSMLCICLSLRQGGSCFTCSHYKKCQAWVPRADERKLSRGRSEPVDPDKMRKGTVGEVEWARWSDIWCGGVTWME